ncbi:hypothetical protein [Desulforhopalus singaporensis]|uniref:Uncharacterized protein n=1 Tax=Desulforhopalus singaporensis TaxID=91360 RepID=A0A1H0LAK9_9BACT|nr:hypothetical protein [Desulforhopalus singaporensis]SDO65237.1 hypothetical protein SAMN05660330_00727 [Desulforhopalus singaporensis]
MKVFVVMRFDPMQCGACGNGKLDRIFTTIEEARTYVTMSGNRRGVSWEISERTVEEFAVKEKLAA